ncbi:MAG: aminopeptidase, partial [Clostridia bacterium]|nr:aminopeptidase [Clostridia bacterium]
YEGRDVLRNSKCLSADVNAAYDPTWSTPFEKNNSSFLNNGVCVTKFTGARGKSGTSDASAEYVSWVKTLLEENHVLWQSGELGKVDAGGGGTVAMYIANMDVDTIDVGVPVLSMHSPYEIVAKIDVYMAYKAFLTFFTK